MYYVFMYVCMQLSNNKFDHYTATTRSGALGGRLSNHKVFFLYQKIFKFFRKRTNKIQRSTVQPLKTLQSFKLT